MTTQTSFSFGAMIKSGYQLFKNHAKFIILAGLVTFIVEILLQLIQNGAQMSRGGFIVNMIVTFFVGIIGLIISIGWSKALLKIGRGNGATWNDFKSEPVVWLKFIKAYLWYFAYFIAYAFIASIAFIILAIIGFAANVHWLTLVGTILGTIAFVAVSIYFSTRYKFMKFVVLDNPLMRSRDMFKHAGLITKGSLIQLFGFTITLGFLNLLGLICLVVGLLVTIPTSKIAEVKVYEYLKEKYTA